jgi:hypothetical protein
MKAEGVNNSHPGCGLSRWDGMGSAAKECAMVALPTQSIQRVRTVDKDGWRQLVDEQARRTLGIGVDDFVANYKAGAYDEADNDPSMMWLVMLLPEEL